jgi:hypothetical protein
MATQLKTDSWHRYMLYRSDERYEYDDFDHDHGFGMPYSHNWANGVRDKGNRVSILPH